MRTYVIMFLEIAWCIVCYSNIYFTYDNGIDFGESYGRCSKLLAVILVTILLFTDISLWQRYHIKIHKEHIKWDPFSNEGLSPPLLFSNFECGVRPR